MALIPTAMRSGRSYRPNPKPMSCISANAVYIGDAVLATGTANAQGLMGCDICGDGTATILGVCVGIVPTSYDSTPYKTTATDERILLIETDPEILYAIKEDALVSPLAVTDVGSVIDLVGGGAGSNTSGISTSLLNSDTAATGSSAQLIIAGMSQDIGNAIGTTSSVYEVYINESQLPAGQAVNGV